MSYWLFGLCCLLIVGCLLFVALLSVVCCCSLCGVVVRSRVSLVAVVRWLPVAVGFAVCCCMCCFVVSMFGRLIGCLLVVC